jgi:hypothetical protein
MSSRKKFSRLLGKELEYSATFCCVNDTRVVVKDVHQDGKYITDHVCISNCYALNKFKDGDKISFTGTASTYTDSKGVRKHGLQKCHDYRKSNDSYQVVMHDHTHRTKRVKNV